MKKMSFYEEVAKEYFIAKRQLKTQKNKILRGGIKYRIRGLRTLMLEGRENIIDGIERCPN